MGDGREERVGLVFRISCHCEVMGGRRGLVKMINQSVSVSSGGVNRMYC